MDLRLPEHIARSSCSNSEDTRRLPQGFKRIGYDADTQRYLFRDTRTNTLWEGPEGSYYGTLKQVEENSVICRMPSVKSRVCEDGEKDFDTTTARRTSKPGVTFDSILGGTEIERWKSWQQEEKE